MKKIEYIGFLKQSNSLSFDRLILKDSLLFFYYIDDMNHPRGYHCTFKSKVSHHVKQHAYGPFTNKQDIETEFYNVMEYSKGLERLLKLITS